MLATATPSWPALRTPPGARISLLAFQLEPALAVTHGLASRILIADEVGLGKTIQAGLVVSEILDRTRHGRVLVVAPAALREQWQAELRDRFGLHPWIADSAALSRPGTAWSMTRNPWSAHPVTITSIDFVKRPEVIRSLEPLVWDAVIFDEAHALTGRSDRSAASRALGRRARTLLLLTATPHDGDAEAFDALCRIGDLDGGFPLLVFRRTRHDAGLSVSRRTVALRVRPSLAEREMHRALAAYAQAVWSEARASSGARLAMAVLTRRACSSATSLARSIERRLALLGEADPDTPRQMALPIFDPEADEDPGAELAAPGLHDRAQERERLEQILRLASGARRAESKIAALTRFLRRLDEPAIVFTEYRDTLATLADALQSRAPVMLHGGLTPAERRDVLQRFTTGGAGLLLATDAASEGLNLQQRCRLVINLELPWTPLRLEQRVGRVERIGQSRRVHAVHLLAAGTSEELLVARLVLRARRAAEVLDGLRSSATDAQVAAVVIGREPIEDTKPGSLPALNTAPAGLRTQAHDEAARLGHLRALVAGSADGWPDGRPPVVIRRGPKRRRETLCGIRLVFAAADQRVVWDTLAGAAVAHPETSLERHGSTAWLERTIARLDRPVAALARRTLAALSDSLAAPLDLAYRREAAISGAIAAERARLAAGLLQPGLFDRRAERIGAARDAVLDEALGRCRDRLEEIARTGCPDVEHRLAFAIVGR